MLDLINIRLDKEDIMYRRAEVARLFMYKSVNVKNEAISSISSDDHKLLFQLYDQVFFDDWFSNNFKGRLKFSLSRKMTRSAGLTLCPKNIDKIKPEELVIEIRIGVDFFFHYNEIEGHKTVCGVGTSNSLDALLVVFEHELCHAIEFIHFKKSSCKGSRFKAIAGNLFGHTESYHKLPTHKQIACQKMGLNIGDTVSFMFEGKNMKGILYSINKRATIMVKDRNGRLTDKQGNRYSKYLVPLTLLR